MATRTLTELEQHILTFEGSWAGRPGAKGAAVRAVFGWREASYELRLQALLVDPAALVWDPMLVKRALKVREERAQTRSRRTFRHVS